MWRGSPRRCMSCSQSQSRATDDRWRYVYYWLIGPDDQTKVIMHSLLNQARVWNLGIGFDGSGNRNYQNFENSANFGIFWSKLFENLTDFEWIRIIFDKFKKKIKKPKILGEMWVCRWGRNYRNFGNFGPKCQTLNQATPWYICQPSSFLYQFFHIVKTGVHMIFGIWFCTQHFINQSSIWSIVKSSFQSINPWLTVQLIFFSFSPTNQLVPNPSC